MGELTAAEFVLRIITDKQDLVITDCETQKDMIWRFKGRIKVQIHTGRDTIPVCRI